jgi:hypothetical protein
VDGLGLAVYVAVEPVIGFPRERLTITTPDFPRATSQAIESVLAPHGLGARHTLRLANPLPASLVDAARLLVRSSHPDASEDEVRRTADEALAAELRRGVARDLGGGPLGMSCVCMCLGEGGGAVW